MAKQASAPVRVVRSESSRSAMQTFAATPDQVRHARSFLRGVLKACPVVDDAVLMISELCANAVQHSDSRKPGGTFTVRTEVHEAGYVWAEVEDSGGLWVPSASRSDGGGHGLGIVRTMASDWGRDGDAATGWVMWFRLEWPATRSRPALSAWEAVRFRPVGALTCRLRRSGASVTDP
jgi:anti-sigma regulatory factor (Ser/Thr protein kinase)